MQCSFLVSTSSILLVVSTIAIEGEGVTLEHDNEQEGSLMFVVLVHHLKKNYLFLFVRCMMFGFKLSEFSPCPLFFQ